MTTLEGIPIYGLNEAQLFQPASNAKLFTTSAALALLGPDRTFTTRLVGSFSLKGHIVEGDLILLGAGDPNFDSQDLPYLAPAARPKSDPKHPTPHQPNPMRDINELVAQLVAKGITQIRGDVVGDDRLFPWEPYPQDWAIDDAVWGYGAPVSALTIADNQLRLEIAPSPVIGQPANVTLEQTVPYYVILNQTSTVATKAESTGVQVERTVGSRTLRLYGSIALRDEPDVEHVAIDDPAEYAAMVLRATLIEHGIAVSGTVRVNHRSPTDASGFLSSLRKDAPENAASLPGARDLKACVTEPLPGFVTLASHTSSR